MKKVLEYLPSNTIRPTGGPAGYVFNLLSGFTSNEVHLETMPAVKAPAFKKAKEFFPKFLVDYARGVNERKKVREMMKGEEKIPDIDQYSAIHFHTPFDLVRHKKQLANYHGKVILTTHAPEPNFLELFDNYFSKIVKFSGGKNLEGQYEKLNEEAFYLADYILFPCEEAEEPYLEKWNEYNKIRVSNQSKYVYLPTGCIAKQVEVCSEKIRQELNLKDKFVVSYAGRHNFSKGYDVLKSIGQSFLSNNPDCYFLVCGKQNDPIKSLNRPNWIEMGFLQNAGDYINASDLFLLPNRETYFDLVLLEVLSLGKIVLIADNGGNKYFKRFHDSGIFYFNSPEEALALLEKIKKLSVEERKLLEQNNRQLFMDNFTSQIFCSRYKQFYEDVINNTVKRLY